MSSSTLARSFPSSSLRGVAACALALALGGTLLDLSQRVDGCGGVPPPPVCGRLTALTKAPPAIIPVAPAGGFFLFPTTVNVGATAACAAPLTTTISLSVACLPPPGAAGSITIATPAPGLYPVLVPVFIPPGPPRLCTVFGSATTTWADGATTTGTGDTTFCVVEPSPTDPTVPRLNMELLTPAIQSAHPGDQRVHVFRFTNNDPAEIVVVDLDADSEQSSRLGTGTGFPDGSGQGLYSVSDPGQGDNFPIGFVDDLGPEGCLPLPIDPMAFPIPHATKQLMLQPGESRIVALAHRSWPMCACGSMCESRIHVTGMWTDGTPALACSGAGLIVDCSVPPDFDCDDGGTANQLVGAGPGQLDFAVESPAVPGGTGTLRVLESLAVANGPIGGIPFPSEPWDGFRGRTRTHFEGDGIAANVGQQISVTALIESTLVAPGVTSELAEHFIWYPGPLSPKQWVWLDAKSKLSGPDIPPTVDSFFDVFTTVTLDGVSNGLHRRATIVPGSFTYQPVSASQYAIGFTAQFPPLPGFPNVVNSFDLHVDASSTTIGVGAGPNVCGGANHDCTSPGGAGCSDVVCCNAVCALEPFCCAAKWDELCVELALGVCYSGPQPNDECSGALELPLGTTSFSTVAATSSPVQLPDSCDEGFGTTIEKDLWYFIDSTCTGTLTVSTCGSADFDTRLAVYAGCPQDGDTLLACNDDAPGCAGFTSSVSFEAVCGARYWIRLGGYSGGGTGELTLSCDGGCPQFCAPDLNGDGSVGGADLTIVLGGWGQDGPSDLNGDGTTNGADLAELLGNWGECQGYVYTWDWNDTTDDIEYGVSEANGNRIFVVGGEVEGAVELGQSGLPDLKTSATGSDDEKARVRCKKAGSGSVLVKIVKDGTVVSQRKFCFTCEHGGADPQRVDCE